MDEREHLGRNRVPDDPATPEESATIHYAIKSSDGNQGGSPYYPRPVRISSETQDALESLERARHALDVFVRRED
jgi:hypothetical protein